MQPLSLLLATLLVVAPPESKPEAPPSEEEAVLRRVAEMKPAEQQEWLRSLEARLERIADALLSPEDAAKRKDQYAAVLHRKTVTWRDLLLLLREASQREKAAISRLAREYRIHALEAFARDRPEYDRRRAAFARVMESWEDAGSPVAEQGKMLGWLEQAARSVTPGTVSPLPPDPTFAVDPAARRAAQARRGATKAERPPSGNPPDNTRPKDEGRTPPKNEKKTPGKDEGTTPPKDVGSPGKDEEKSPPKVEAKTGPKDKGETKLPKSGQSAPAREEQAPPEKPKQGADDQPARQHAAAEPLIAPLAAGPFTWVGPPNSPPSSAAVVERRSPSLAITGSPTALASGRASGGPVPTPPLALGTPRQLAELHNVTAGSSATPRLSYTARRLASPPATSQEAARASSPVQVKVADLCARIDGTNLALRTLEAKLDEDHPWTAQQLAPLVERLKTLVRQQNDLAAIRALVPEDERAAVTEPETPQSVIAQLGRRIFEARTAAERAALSPADRSRELARLDALSRDLAALGAK